MMDGVIASHSVNRLFLSVAVTILYIFVSVEISRMTDG